jgi:hypothetical protein
MTNGDDRELAVCDRQKRRQRVKGGQDRSEGDRRHEQDGGYGAEAPGDRQVISPSNMSRAAAPKP